MYAEAKLIQFATSETTSVPTRNRNLSVRGNLTRFLNWFGSGGVDARNLKAGHGHGSDFMLINGQVVITPSCREETGADSYMM